MLGSSKINRVTITSFEMALNSVSLVLSFKYLNVCFYPVAQAAYGFQPIGRGEYA
jgi:hypothetical protein